MKNLHILFLLCFSLITIHLKAEDYIISLQNATLGINAFDFHVEKVVDARDVDNYIGFVQRGIGNNKVAAKLGETSAADELQALFSRSFKGSKNGLIIRVNKLLIYEVTYTGKEYAFAELNLSFLKREGDDYIELFETGAALTKSTAMAKGVWDVTKTHSDNILEVLQICFKQFRDVIQENKIVGTLVTASALIENPLKTRHYPIFDATQFPKGVYKTFTDFRNNTSDTSIEFRVEYDQKKSKERIEAIPTWADKTFYAAGVWGFSDGKDVFINIDGNFYLVKKENNDFIVFAPSLNKGNAAFGGAILGGIAGALLVDALDSGKGKEMKYKVDLSTGAIEPFQTPNYKRMEARSVLYFSSFAKDGSQLTIFVDGEERCTLTPGSYFVLRTKPSQTQVEICLSSNGEKICESLIPKLLKTENYLCRLEKKGTPVLESPSAGTHQSIQEKIREGKATELCEK